MFGSFFGNIFGTLYFLYFQIAGILIMMFFLKKENNLTKIILGSVLGNALLQYIPFLFSLIFDFGFWAHALSFVVLLPVFYLFVRRFVLSKKIDIMAIGAEIRELIFIRYRTVSIVMAAFMLLWFWLLYSHNLRLGSDGIMHTGQCGWGDMNMHLGFITSIAKQKMMPPEYSIYPGNKLGYPFLSDSISSSIYIMGASLRWAYTLPMIFAFAHTLCMFFLIANSFLKSKEKSILALLLYFLNGGFGFAYFLNWSHEGGYKFKDIFTGFYTTPTNLTGENIRFVNIIADMLLPQRATLFGYATLFAAIYLLYKAVFEDRRSYFVVAAVFGSALPMVHTHSFLSFGLIAASFLLAKLFIGNGKEFKGDSGLFFIGYMVLMVILEALVRTRFGDKILVDEKYLMHITIGIFTLFVAYGIYQIVLYVKDNGYKDIVKTWGYFLIIVVVLSLPQLIGFGLKQVAGSGEGFVGGYFNWGNQGENYIWFYFKNIGIVFVLGLAGLCGLDKKKFAFALPIVPLMLVVDTIGLTPNRYDNNKVLYVAYMFFVIIAADYTIRIWNRIKQMKGSLILAAFFITIGFLSGLLTIGREAASDMELYGADQVEMARWIEDNTEPTDVFLTSDRHNNIISSMTGRNIVCGYGGLLGPHGFNTTERLEEEKLMFEDPEAHMDLYEKYDVSYICCSSYENYNYEIDYDKYDSLFDRAFECDGTILYKVRR